MCVYGGKGIWVMVKNYVGYGGKLYAFMKEKVYGIMVKNYMGLWRKIMWNMEEK